tara:strand:+ start:182 stop:400 length:219 start_codon:yes stop_codon:yes gene_type:complete
MHPFLTKNLVTIIVIIMTTVFSFGYLKAETNSRLVVLENEIQEVKAMVRSLDDVVDRLESAVSKLEYIVENK